MHQVLLFVFKMKNELPPKLFADQFSSIEHKYNTRFSENNFKVPRTILKSTTFSIRHRGPLLWNSFLDRELKSLTTLNSFKRTVKMKLIMTEVNKSKYF